MEKNVVAKYLGVVKTCGKVPERLSNGCVKVPVSSQMSNRCDKVIERLSKYHDKVPECLSTGCRKVCFVNVLEMTK